LVFRNENASGLPEKDKTFSLPIRILTSSNEITKFSVYFGVKTLENTQTSCTNVFSVERQVPKTTAVARAALEELLRGPTTLEKSEDYYTSVNPGVKIQSLTIDGAGTAKVDFDEQLEKGVGGSCKVSAIRAQITQTLKQFPTIKNVIISINGRTEDILQP
jgi:spore germination protein GerM